MPRPSDEVLDLQWSPDGRRLASCSRDLTTIVYDVSYGAPGGAVDGPGAPTVALAVRWVFRRPPEAACVCRLAFSDCGHFLLCCTEEHEVSCPSKDAEQRRFFSHNRYNTLAYCSRMFVWWLLASYLT